MGVYRECIIQSVQTSISKSAENHNARDVFSADVMNQIFSGAFMPYRTWLEAVAIFIDSIYFSGMLALKKTRCVEKSPHTCAVAHILYKMFPDIKYIHAVRDPKDICCSMVPLPWGPNSVTEFIQSYQAGMKKTLLSLKALPHQQLLTVELEILVEKPDETIKALCDFLNLPYSSRELSQFVHIIKSPADANIGRHLRELSQKEAETIEKYCGELYRELCNLSNKKKVCGQKKK
jgi:hypothetical protein